MLFRPKNICVWGNMAQKRGSVGRLFFSYWSLASVCTSFEKGVYFMCEVWCRRCQSLFCITNIVHRGSNTFLRNTFPVRPVCNKWW